MKIVAAFDVDQRRKSASASTAREVQPRIPALPDFVRSTQAILLGLIATPANAAQGVANLMVAGGILAIWNFAPAHIDTSRSG